MGNDIKTIRSKITLWQFFAKTYGLFYITLVAPCWLSVQAVQECIETLPKLLYDQATSDQMSLPINDLP